MEAAALPVDGQHDNSTDHLVELDESGEPTLGEIVRSEILERSEYRNKVLALRRQGMTAGQISDELAKEGIHRHPTNVQRFINRYLERLAATDRESAGALRALEDERLDALLRVYMLKAQNGDEKAAKLVLQISERRAKLHGLDAPQVMEHRGSVALINELGVDPDEIERERVAFETAYERPGLPDPAEKIVDATVVEDEPAEDIGSTDS